MVHDVGVDAAQVDDLGGLIEQRACGCQLGLHSRQHVIDRREFVDALLELFAFGSILAGFAVSGFGNADRLGADGHAGAVHQGHDVTGQTAARLSAEFRRHMVILQFAGGDAVDTELVLDAADDQFRAFFADEHGKAAAVRAAFDRTGEHQVDLGAAVGDEAFVAVEIPFAGGGVLGGFEPHGLQVGTGIRFGQVHGAVGFAAGKPRQIALTLVFIAEFTDGLGDILQTEQVLQRGVRAGHHFGHHRVDRCREVESAVYTGQHHAGDSGAAQVFQIFHGQRMVGHHAVFEMGTFFIDLTGTRGDPFAGYIADHGQDPVVIVHGIRKVLRRTVVFLRLGVILFTDGHHFFQIKVLEREDQILIVSIKVRHVMTPLRLWLCRL